MKNYRKKHKPASTPERTESMAALAGGMVDDFNNILTTVMGACSLIDREDPANDELLQYVEVIRASAERAALLSVRLMRVSAMEQEKNHLNGHPPEASSADTSARDKKSIHDIVSTNNQSDGASS
jgi:nitrogen-specific signal transduction histidine kinase